MKPLKKQPFTRQIGDGVTQCLVSDCHAYTVIAIEGTEKRPILVIQRDRAYLLNGLDSGEPDALKHTPGGFVGHTSGVQRWAYEPNPDGEIRRYSARKNGHWYQVGQSSSTTTPPLRIGRHERYDFNF